MAQQIINPKWIKKTGSVEHAASQAHHRGYRLILTWSNIGGTKVIAESIRDIPERGS